MDELDVGMYKILEPKAALRDVAASDCNQRTWIW